jgi:hypothetical protein
MSNEILRLENLEDPHSRTFPSGFKIPIRPKEIENLEDPHSRSFPYTNCPNPRGLTLHTNPLPNLRFLFTYRIWRSSK